MEKLNGSFSGLWTCELCGKTGTDCTCEHFARGFGSVWGKNKTLTDAEFAAEMWKARAEYEESFFELSIFGGKHKEKFSDAKEKLQTLDQMADNQDYKEREDNE